jgi:hypothetical protein
MEIQFIIILFSRRNFTSARPSLPEALSSLLMSEKSKVKIFKEHPYIYP